MIFKKMIFLQLHKELKMESSKKRGQSNFLFKKGSHFNFAI